MENGRKQAGVLNVVMCGVSFAALAALTWLAWNGRLGVVALLLLVVTFVGYVFGRRGLTSSQLQVVDTVAKGLFTLAGSIALLRHPIPIDGAAPVPVHRAITDYIDNVETGPFIEYSLIAMFVKFAGVIASAYAWHLLLVGQGVRYPFWSMIMTSFLVGRFIGTVMPGTIGLDGYTLYEAGRYSNQWPRVVTAKMLEKIIGITGLFLGMVLTMPAGYDVIHHVTEKSGRPGAAPLLAGLILAIAGGVSLAVMAALVRPALLTKLVELLGRFLPGGVRVQVARYAAAIGAYHGQVGLLFLCLFSKFVTHFTTAMVYFFTALAIGVVGAEFWPIVFGSTIQILATVFSPTIAGEGAREAVQALMLSRHLGGVAQAVLSGALGFIAAEAATLWGGLFLFVRTPKWRPAFCLVDDKQVDYEWLEGDDHRDWRKPEIPR